MATLKPGDKAPAFALADQNKQQRSLADYKGHALFIYFYPKALTPGCTTQSCNVRDALAELTPLGVAVVGISPDPPLLQKQFDERHGLGFPLLADTEHAVAEAYGVWGEKSMYGKTYMGITRSAFLIDAKGKIAQAWYKIRPEETVPELRRVLGSLQS